MGVRREAFTVRDIEPQVIPLIRGRLLVTVDEDDKADCVSYCHRDVGIGSDGHLEAFALHNCTPITGQKKSFPIVQDDSFGCDL